MYHLIFITSARYASVDTATFRFPFAAATLPLPFGTDYLTVAVWCCYLTVSVWHRLPDRFRKYSCRLAGLFAAAAVCCRSRRARTARFLKLIQKRPLFFE
ncbi:hypothetical protein MmiAt1_12940 [Methanimicrococcus sp. At1]|uniref:Uncharacterized protein n=1 Tax=Methanimicrococcus hacksteinii TaxID=3028293 RepID=A0ABU3VQW3_9EURY|nr:hypothetical protein [Methanimicrococcus sp. At1]MDV0445700.1 hypothetical protein [Methanimicrococcus sp. At1]